MHMFNCSLIKMVFQFAELRQYFSSNGLEAELFMSDFSVTLAEATLLLYRSPYQLI